MKLIQGLVDALSYLVGRIRGEWARQQRLYALDQEKVRQHVLYQARLRGMDTTRPWHELQHDLEAEWREE